MTIETPAAEPHLHGRGELLRVLGVGFGIAVVVGGVVGQGIMRTPGIVAGALTSGVAQNVGSALKAFALLIIVGLCFAAPHAAVSAAPPPLHPALTVAAIAISMRAIYNTYAGWNTCVYFCEEVCEPHRNIA